MEEGKETLALSTIRSLGKIQLKMTKLLTIAVKEDDRNDSKWDLFKHCNNLESSSKWQLLVSSPKEPFCWVNFTLQPKKLGPPSPHIAALKTLAQKNSNFQFLTVSFPKIWWRWPWGGGPHKSSKQSLNSRIYSTRKLHLITHLIRSLSTLETVTKVHILS